MITCCPICNHEWDAAKGVLGLTQKQRELLLFIRRYIGEHGITPSYQEMVDALGLHSKSGIHRLVKALEERGHITRKKSRARSINLAPVIVKEIA